MNDHKLCDFFFNITNYFQCHILSNHRLKKITEAEFQQEGTIESHLLQLACSKQRHPELNQAAQSPTQPDPECFQGWNIYTSGISVPVFQCFTILIKKNQKNPVFLKCILNPPSFSLKPLSLVLITTGPVKQFIPVFSYKPLLSNERPQEHLPGALPSPG